MKKLFLVEIKSTLRSRFFLTLCAVMVFLSWNTGNNYYKNLNENSLKWDDTSIVYEEEYYISNRHPDSVGEHVFYHAVASGNTIAPFLEVILAAVLIAMPYDTKRFGRKIALGFSRKQIFAATTAQYYVIAAIITCIHPVLMWLTYSKEYLASLGGIAVVKILQMLIAKFIFSLPGRSVMLCAAFLSRSIIMACGINLALLFALNIPNTIAIFSNLDYIKILPGAQLNYIFRNTVVPKNLYIAVGITTLTILVTLFIAYQHFSKKDLS